MTHTDRGLTAEPIESSRRLDARQRLIVVIALVVGVITAMAHALTKLPHIDEGDLGSAAIAILERGHMAFPFTYSYLPSFRSDYLLPPFYFYSLAGWFGAAGRTIEAYRLYHVVWWVVLTLCWLSVVRSVSRAAVGTVFAALLLALNYDTINLGVSRYDVVTAALNAAAVASYVGWRRTRFTLAVIAANSCLALAAITHPHAIFGLLTCLILVVTTGDWRRVRGQHALVALIPYVFTFGAWAWLIDGRWSLFLEQMSYGARSKRGFGGDPLNSLATDLQVRWWQLFAGWRDGVPSVMKAKTAFLAVWLIAAIAALFDRKGDDHAAVTRGLALSTLCSVLLLAFIDTARLQIYVINVVPPAVVTLSLLLASLWHTQRSLKPVVVVAVGGMALFGAAAIAYRVRANELHTKYGTVAHLVADSVGAGDILIAPAELAYAHRFAADIRSDARLTSVTTGPLPKAIVRSLEQSTLALPRVVPCAVSGPAHADSASYADITPAAAADKYRLYVRRRSINANDTTTLLVRDCRKSPGKLGTP